MVTGLTEPGCSPKIESVCKDPYEILTSASNQLKKLRAMEGVLPVYGVVGDERSGKSTFIAKAVADHWQGIHLFRI